MYYRTTDKEKITIVERYLAGERIKKLSLDFKVSTVAIRGLLKRRNIKIRPDQLSIARKYEIDETFFDEVNTEEKSYFLGFLYADGYNNTNRHSVSINLHEKDKEILIKLNMLLKSNKPLQYINYKEKYGSKNRGNQFRLVIANKHISQRLSELGCVKAKTYILTFPDWIDKQLIRHFIRGYFDGDGWAGEKNICIVSTEEFCNVLSEILKKELNINTYIRARHPKRKNTIRMLEVSGRKQTYKFLKWIYEDATILLKRKLENASRNILKLGLLSLDKGAQEGISIESLMNERTLWL